MDQRTHRQSVSNRLMACTTSQIDGVVPLVMSNVLYTTGPGLKKEVENCAGLGGADNQVICIGELIACNRSIVDRLLNTDVETDTPFVVSSFIPAVMIAEPLYKAPLISVGAT